MANFSDVAELISGVTFKKADSKSEKLPGTIGVLRAGNIQDSEVIMDDVVYVPDRFVKSSQQLKEGDILIASSSGSLDVVGKAAAVPSNVNVAFGAFCKVARPKREVVFPAYFKHFFRSTGYKREVRERAEGANINNLNRGDFLSLQIPLPPLQEQKRIAGILDEADRVRKKTQALIDKYDELAQSLFLDMFGDPVTNPKGWEVKPLGDVSILTTKGESPKWQGHSYSAEGVRFVTSENVRMGFLNFPKEKFVPIKFHEKLKRSQLKQNDLLINLVGASIGRGALVHEDLLPANINQAVAKTELDIGQVEPDFILHQILLPQVQSRLIQSQVEGARANISLKDIKEIRLIVPSLQLQNEFASRLKCVLEQRRMTASKMQSMDDLFSALLQKAFKGELN